MSSGISAEKPCVICLGATIPPSFACLLKSLARPEMDGVKWVADKNLFVGFQNFYKKKPNLDLKGIVSQVREEIYHPFFPIMLRPVSVELSPNPSKPSALKIRLEVASIKDTTLHTKQQIAKLSAAMKETIKTSSAAFQTHDCDMQITLAHISSKALDSPDFHESINQVKLLGDIREPFYLDKACMVEVIKENSGLVYNYYSVE